MDSVAVLCCVLTLCAVVAIVVHDLIATGVEMLQKTLMPRLTKASGFRQFYFLRRRHD